MKRSLLTALTSFFFLFGLFGQTSNNEAKIKKRHSSEILEIESSTMKTAAFTQHYYQELGLNSPEDLEVHKTINGLGGWTRVRMQQQYKGLKVIGGTYILHEQNGIVRKASGEIFPLISLSTKPQFNSEKAQTLAENYINSTLLSKANGAATVLPVWDVEKAELVVMDKAYPKFSGDYALAYHVIISNLEGINQIRQSVYIDASESTVIASISEIAHTSVEGLANTKYYGEQRIITDSIAPNLFVLQDFTRGDGIVTLNGLLEDFEDEDNFWNNFGNKEEVGTDAHYCAASYYDFMVDNYNWSGLDGEGFELRSRVYGTENSTVNATWNGQFSTFFSGDCDEFGPLTSLDVVGHEFAHGFTDFTSDLIYQDESGALNEAISDILGKALEFKYDPENFNWLVGDKFVLTDNDDHFRDMANPNTKNHPKFYAGNFWSKSAADSGGVHTNSGVLNFWFYLLTEGQADINEDGVEYDVQAIGIEKATDIIFTMNTAYLTESSTYTKAVISSIETVKDLYGENSLEMQSVLEAWKAVGLFPDSGEYDLRIVLAEPTVTVCADELDSHFTEVHIINDGVLPYVLNDQVKLRYIVGGLVQEDIDLTLDQDLNPGDSLSFTFPEPAPLNATGQNFTVEVNLIVSPSQNSNNTSELVTTNNVATGLITASAISGLDIQVNSITLLPVVSCRAPENAEIRMIVQNIGCVEIPEGDYQVSLIAAGSEYNYDISLISDIRVGGFAVLSSEIVMPDEIANGEELEVRLTLPGDLNSDNNIVEGEYFFVETISEGFVENFDDFDDNSDKRIVVTSDFRSDSQVGSLNDDAVLVISGLSNLPFNLENCVEEDLFVIENFQKTEIDICVNAEGLLEPVFSFDLNQFRRDGEIANISNQAFAVMVQVSIGEEKFPAIFNQEEGEWVSHEFPLSIDFVGEILIEVITLRGNSAFVFNDDYSRGDFALIDNIALRSGTVSTQDVEVPSDISVFPNPSSDLVYFSTTNPQEFDLIIYNGLGQMQANLNSARTQAVWDSRSANDGIYYYEIIFADKSKRQGKVIVYSK